MSSFETGSWDRSPGGTPWGSRQPNVLAGLRAQIRVIKALMIRDALSRFGHGSLGFFWIIAEPMLLTAGVMVLWSITRFGHGLLLGGVIPFALTGYTFITLWRHLVGRSTRPVRNNASLFYLRRVRLIDVLIASALLETVAIFAAFVIVYIPFALFDLVPLVHDPLLSIGGYLLSAWFGFGFGLIIAGLSELDEAVERFVQPAMYLTLPGTGVFTMQYWLPGKAQKILAWSPLVNGIEMFRGGILSPETPAQYSVVYLVVWCVALTAIGLPFCHYTQRHAQFDS